MRMVRRNRRSTWQRYPRHNAAQKRQQRHHTNRSLPLRQRHICEPNKRRVRKFIVECQQPTSISRAQGSSANFGCAAKALRDARAVNIGTRATRNMDSKSSSQSMMVLFFTSACCAVAVGLKTLPCDSARCSRARREWLGRVALRRSPPIARRGWRRAPRAGVPARRSSPAPAAAPHVGPARALQGSIVEHRWTCPYPAVRRGTCFGSAMAKGVGSAACRN